MDAAGYRLKPVLARLALGESLSEAEAEAAFDTVMGGDATAAQIGALLMAMRVRGETAAELAGAVRAMRARMIVVPGCEDAVDVCGTGGDHAGTVNVSTAVAFVVAGAGVRVAKHGNRSASSKSGGADVLAALGVRLDPPLARLPAILAEAGCVFLFAPRHHEALRHAAPVRSELGVRTLFNLLGPLANPAGVRRQLTGVYDPAWAGKFAEVLAGLGTAMSWSVHGGGLDELCLHAPNHVVVQQGAAIAARVLPASEWGLVPAPLEDLAGGGPADNAAALLDLLEGRAGCGSVAARRLRAYRDTVLLNAAAALIVSGLILTPDAALARAREALAGGAAFAVLQRLRSASEQA